MEGKQRCELIYIKWFTGMFQREVKIQIYNPHQKKIHKHPFCNL